MIALASAANAQDPNSLPEGQHQLMINGVIILVIYLISAFILKVIKGVQDYRLKNKMIEKGLSEQVVQQFLQPNDQEAKNQTIRACFLLAGIGIGLALAAIFKPTAVAAIALISLTLAAGFLAYFLYLKKTAQ